MGLFHLLSQSLTWEMHHMGVGYIVLSSLPSFLPAILLLCLIQAGGILPKRTTALTGGPSSVLTGLRLPEKADRQSERQVDRRANRRRVRRRRTEQETGASYNRGPSAIFRQACVLCVSQQGRTVGHVNGLSRYKQMFSGYCCSASLVIVFLQGQPVGQGARLCCGKELWGDGESGGGSVLSISSALQAAVTKLSRFFPLCSTRRELQHLESGKMKAFPMWVLILHLSAVKV